MPAQEILRERDAHPPSCDHASQTGLWRSTCGKLPRRGRPCEAGACDRSSGLRAIVAAKTSAPLCCSSFPGKRNHAPQTVLTSPAPGSNRSGRSDRGPLRAKPTPIQRVAGSALFATPAETGRRCPGQAGERAHNSNNGSTIPPIVSVTTNTATTTWPARSGHDESAPCPASSRAGSRGPALASPRSAARTSWTAARGAAAQPRVVPDRHKDSTPQKRTETHVSRRAAGASRLTA